MQAVAVVQGLSVDGVVVYFGDAAPHEICRELNINPSNSAPGSTFQVFPYEVHAWEDELEPDELARLILALGGPPSCAVAIACRHGQAARVALTALAAVMSKFPKSVVDDDFNQLWSSTQVLALKETAPGRRSVRFSANQIALRRSTARCGCCRRSRRLRWRWRRRSCLRSERKLLRQQEHL